MNKFLVEMSVAQRAIVSKIRDFMFSNFVTQKQLADVVNQLADSIEDNTWVHQGGHALSPRVCDLSSVLNATNPENLIGGATNGKGAWIIQTEKAYAFASTDGGYNWSVLDTDLKTVVSVEYHKGAFKLLLSNGDIKSLDDNLNFISRVSTGYVGSLADMAVSKDIMIIGGDGGCMLSTDAGVTWATMPTVPAAKLIKCVNNGTWLIVNDQDNLLLANEPVTVDSSFSSVGAFTAPVQDATVTADGFIQAVTFDGSNWIQYSLTAEGLWEQRSSLYPWEPAPRASYVRCMYTDGSGLTVTGGDYGIMYKRRPGGEWQTLLTDFTGVINSTFGYSRPERGSVIAMVGANGYVSISG